MRLPPGVAIAPDLGEQLVAAEHHAGPPGQAEQEVELGRREGDRTVVEHDLAALRVDDEVPTRTG